MHFFFSSVPFKLLYQAKRVEISYQFGTMSTFSKQTTIQVLSPVKTVLDGKIVKIPLVSHDIGWWELQMETIRVTFVAVYFWKGRPLRKHLQKSDADNRYQFCEHWQVETLLFRQLSSHALIFSLDKLSRSVGYPKKVGFTSIAALITVQRKFHPVVYWVILVSTLHRKRVLRMVSEAIKELEKLMYK